MVANNVQSKLILGTVQFGLDYGINNSTGKPSKEQVFKIFEAAANAGVAILDTADAYGNASELIGEFFSVSKTRFEINTKFKAEGGKSITEQLTHSLGQLNTERINIYFYHRFDEMVKFPETLAELGKLRNQSRINKIGVSVYGNDEFEIAVNTPEVDAIQLPFNLLDNHSQRGELLKQAKQKGKEIQVRSVFLQGLFFKKLSDYPSYLSPLKPYMQTINQIEEDSGMGMEALALSYALAQPQIDNVLIGVDTLEQLQQNLSYSDTALPANIISHINAIEVAETELLYPKNWK
ncbi:aldo/keto reductase [Oscillatoria amoena NRMC-F 0135]|nr:aldo/keto reductase [Oscillatoria amoena NRMC-F 0135]